MECMHKLSRSSAVSRPSRTQGLCVSARTLVRARASSQGSGLRESA